MEVRVQEPEQLRYVGSLGLYPDARVEVVECAPFDGPLTLRVNDEARVIARSLAQRIRVATEQD